jgi:hypothetical protein
MIIFFPEKRTQTVTNVAARANYIEEENKNEFPIFYGQRQCHYTLGCSAL